MAIPIGFPRGFDITRIQGLLVSASGRSLINTADGVSVTSWGGYGSPVGSVTKQTATYRGKSFPIVRIVSGSLTTAVTYTTGPFTAISLTKMNALSNYVPLINVGAFGVFYKGAEGNWWIGRWQHWDGAGGFSATTDVGTTDFHIHVATNEDIAGRSYTSMAEDGIVKSLVDIGDTGASIAFNGIGLDSVSNNVLNADIYASAVFNRVLSNEEKKYVVTGLAADIGLPVSFNF